MGIKCGHCCFPQQPHFLPSLSVSKVSVASRHPPLQGWSAATATSLGDRALSLLCPGRERRHVLLSRRDGLRPLLLPSAATHPPSSVAERSSSGLASSSIAGAEHYHCCSPWQPRSLPPPLPKCAHPPSSLFLRMKSQIKILAEVPPCKGHLI